MTLIEVIVAMVVLLMLLQAITATVMGTHSLRRSQRLLRLAEAAIQSTSEEVRAVSFSALGDPNGWAQTVVAAFDGANFDVNGLSPPPGIASVGTIQVITDETLTDQAIGVPLGLPRDLNDDGMAMSTDVTATAVVLPIVLTVRWSGPGGTNQITHGFHLLGYQ